MIVGVTFSTNRGLRALDAVRRSVRRLSIFVNVSVERWLERATRRETRSPCYFFAAIGPLFYTYIVLVSFTCDIEGRSFDGADGSVCSATVLLLCRTVVSGERTRERGCRANLDWPEDQGTGRRLLREIGGANTGSGFRSSFRQEGVRGRSKGARVPLVRPRGTGPSVRPSVRSSGCRRFSPAARTSIRRPFAR